MDEDELEDELEKEDEDDFEEQEHEDDFEEGLDENLAPTNAAPGFDERFFLCTKCGTVKKVKPSDMQLGPPVHCGLIMKRAEGEDLDDIIKKARAKSEAKKAAKGTKGAKTTPAKKGKASKAPAKKAKPKAKGKK